MAQDFSETNLLVGCRDAEERRKLLGDLFSRHRERLRRMVALHLDRRLLGRIDASDVLQETFIEAARRLDEYLAKADAPLFVWLYFLAAQSLQAVHRRHLGAQARDVRREVSINGGMVPQASSEALAAQLLGQEPSPSEAAIQAERKAALEDALDGMQEADREILVLRNFDQLTNSETARVLGISERAARTRQLRALERLQEILKKIGGGTL